MAVSRYDRDPLINGARSFGSAQSVVIIRDAVRRGLISLKEKIMSESERLDVIAGEQYQDASLWCVIAAASNIGWGLQVPAGTKISIPTNISEILELIA